MGVWLVLVLLWTVGATTCAAISFRHRLSRWISTISFTLLFLGLVFSSYLCHLVRPCGSRTAGEVLFCNSPKEYPEKAATSAAPLEKQGFPLLQYCYHAAPELAHVEKHVHSDSWHRKPMITALPQWLAKVG